MVSIRQFPRVRRTIEFKFRSPDTADEPDPERSGTRRERAASNGAGNEDGHSQRTGNGHDKAPKTGGRIQRRGDTRKSSG